MDNLSSYITKHIHQPQHIAPLAVFRVVFGAMMLASTIRFFAKGWVRELYLEPTFFFSYYGFEWVKPLGEAGMFTLFIAMAIAACCIMLGLWYRPAIILFFLLFTYVELIDLTNYLNHYYFVSVVSLLLIAVPANRYFSLDVLRRPALRCTQVPAWMINIFKLQLGIVYFYAGLAKLHPDWLLEAQPLRIWLPARADLPFIGSFLQMKWVAFFFSWSGALYDLCIPFLLLYRPTRLPAYAAVIAFHVLTALLFPIGMFPYIMILSTLIFFSANFHQKIIHQFRRLFKFNALVPKFRLPAENFSAKMYKNAATRLILPLVCLHFVIQLLFPFRFAAYPGHMFWTEEGYRFSWRVMLMEKAGHITFYIKNPETGREVEVNNRQYITPLQEKMMATQPDMILQFAHFLAREYQQQGIESPQVRADSFVSLNGRRSKRYLDRQTDLCTLKDSFAPKTWLLPFSPSGQEAGKVNKSIL